MTILAGDVRTEITAIVKGIFEAFENHDSDTIESLMHPDATVWDVFTPHLIRGVAERKRFHEDDQKQMQARGPLTMKIDEPIVTDWGDTAIALYYLSYVYEPPNATAGRVRITDVFRRFDGQWKIVHHHEGLVPAGVPPITE